MSIFMKSTSVYGLEPTCLVQLASSVKQALRDLLQEGLEAGVVRPLDRAVLPASHAKQAVSYLDGQCTGKLLLEAKASNVPTSDPQRFTCDEHSSYLVVGTYAPRPAGARHLTSLHVTARHGTSRHVTSRHVTWRPFIRALNDLSASIRYRACR